MAEISTAAYTDLRNHIQSDWKYIELVSDTGSPVIRLTTSDPRVTSTITGNNVTLSIIIKGSDSDIAKPVTITGSKFYDVASGGTPYASETFLTPFTMETDADQLTVNHSILVPQV